MLWIAAVSKLIASASTKTRIRLANASRMIADACQCNGLMPHETQSVLSAMLIECCLHYGVPRAEALEIFAEHWRALECEGTMH